LMYRCRS